MHSIGDRVGSSRIHPCYKAKNDRKRDVDKTLGVHIYTARYISICNWTSRTTKEALEKKSATLAWNSLSFAARMLG